MNRKLSGYFKKKFLVIAKDLLENPQALKFKLESAKDRLNKQSVRDTFGKSFDDLKSLVRMVKAYSSRRFRKVSKQSIVICVAAVIYFLTPTDFVPDFILGLGFLDDLAVFRWALKQIHSDLENFKQWERERLDEKEEKGKTKKGTDDENNS